MRVSRLALIPIALAVWAQAPRQEGNGRLRFAISFSPARSAQPIDGRVLLFISDDGRSEPRTQTDQYRANTTRPIFGVDVDALRPGQDIVIDDSIVGWPARSLRDIPTGDYFVQALVNRYETFHRADGHTIKMPMDQGEGQRWAAKPGNLYSKPVKMHLDAADDGARQDFDGPGNSADRAARGHGAGEIPSRAERSVDEVLGTPDAALARSSCCRTAGARTRTRITRWCSSRALSEQHGGRWLARDAARVRRLGAAAARSRKPPTSSSRIGTDRTSRA
jgi:hypothetical protein